MAEPRILMFHDAAEARRWQDALDRAGLPAQCFTFEDAAKDERGYWQPPRYHWYDISRDGVTKHIYLIDGFWFRNNVQIDFSEGGNHMAYTEIPEDCEYIELGNDENTIDERIVAEHHETPEDILMSDDPMCVYEEAHGFATHEERMHREPYRDPRVIADPPSHPDESKAADRAPAMMALVEEVIAERRRHA